MLTNCLGSARRQILILNAVGMTKPGSLKARQAKGRAPLNALTKRDGEYRKVRASLWCNLRAKNLPAEEVVYTAFRQKPSYGPRIGSSERQTFTWKPQGGYITRSISLVAPSIFEPGWHYQLGKASCLQIEVGEGKMAEITMHRPRRNGSKGEAEKAAEFEGNLLVLAVGNSRQAGGGVQLCPDALLDDGLLDVS